MTFKQIMGVAQLPPCRCRAGFYQLAASKVTCGGCGREVSAAAIISASHVATGLPVAA